MRKLVLFDVDHTVVKGNLTGLICRRMFSWRDIGRLVSFVYRATSLVHGRFPQAVERALIHQDYCLVDQIVRKHVASCYHLLLDLLESCDVSLSDLSKQAHLFVSDELIIKRICYKKALDRILMHAQDPEVDILFVSGGLQVVLDPLVIMIRRYIEKKGLCKARLFGYGTRFLGDGDLDLCVGSYKVDRVNEHIKYEASGHAAIVSAYSDNRYYSDLPFLLLAEERFMVEGFDVYAKILPDEIQKSLTFCSRWK
ncbi:hypothetical protein JKY79_00275 [Candidatus Babeliales bacterium]|nr:hypothetical protein [Candidatus Babeliales bacterium]